MRCLGHGLTEPLPACLSRIGSQRAQLGARYDCRRVGRCVETACQGPTGLLTASAHAWAGRPVGTAPW